MLVLSDALEEAGCNDNYILKALRSGENYFRGFWVLDLILNKN